MSKTKIRLYIDTPLQDGVSVSLPEGSSHYLRNVMRARPGNRIAVFNGSDGEWTAEIASLTKSSGTLDLVDQTLKQDAEPDIWLGFAPLKKTRTDFLVEKATELGVTRLLPVFTDYTDTNRVNSERLSAMAVEAAEQCRRLSVPVVKKAVALSGFLENWPSDRMLFVPDETGGGQALVEVLSQKQGKRQSSGFLIGPEGGFSPSELDVFEELPFVTRVGLGPRILRAETAAITALSCWQALIGDGNELP